MKTPLVIAFLATLAALPMPASATPCVIVDTDGYPPVYYGDCGGVQEATNGRLVIFGANDLCIAVQPFGSVPPVEVYECQSGAVIP